MSPSGAGPGAALSALSIGGGSEAVVRGELIAGDGGIPRFAALRRLRWGTPILTERPLLLLEPDLDRCWWCFPQFLNVLDLFWICFGLFLDCFCGLFLDCFDLFWMI